MEKHISLSPESEQIILEVKESQMLRSTSATIDYIIRDYAKRRELTDSISEKVTEDLSKMLTRIRLGTNTADINSQIIIELLNAIIFKMGVEPMTTGFQETPALTVSRDYIKSNIAKYKQNKDQKTN